MVDFIPIRFSAGTLSGGQAKKVLGLSCEHGIQPSPHGSLEVVKIQLQGDVTTPLADATLTLRIQQLDEFDVPATRCEVQAGCDAAGIIDQADLRTGGDQFTDAKPLFVDVELSAGAVQVDDVGGIIWCRVNDA